MLYFVFFLFITKNEMSNKLAEHEDEQSFQRRRLSVNVFKVLINLLTFLAFFFFAEAKD